MGIYGWCGMIMALMIMSRMVMAFAVIMIVALFMGMTFLRPYRCSRKGDGEDCQGGNRTDKGFHGALLQGIKVSDLSVSGASSRVTALRLKCQNKVGIRAMFIKVEDTSPPKITTATG